jgi:hypothetical protein
LENLFTEKALAEILSLDSDDIVIRHICKEKSLRHRCNLLTAHILRIVVHDGRVSIKINIADFVSFLKRTYSVSMSEPVNSGHVIDVPFVAGRAKTGSLILSPADKSRNDRDPFDRSEPEIRAWVQGIVWRDEHFCGIPLQKIADLEGVFATHILKYINKALEVS